MVYATLKYTHTIEPRHPFENILRISNQLGMQQDRVQTTIPVTFYLIAYVKQSKIMQPNNGPPYDVTVVPITTRKASPKDCSQISVPKNDQSSPQDQPKKRSRKQ